MRQKVAQNQDILMQTYGKSEKLLTFAFIMRFLCISTQNEHPEKIYTVLIPFNRFEII